MSVEPPLSIQELAVTLDSGTDICREMSFEVGRGEVVALVGESGCGKTATALACLGYARPGTRIAGGEIYIAGTDILRLAESARRRLRGRVISYVPQNPGTTLNPGFRIGAQLDEALEVHGISDSEGAAAVAEDAMRAVSLPSTPDFLRRYPHELSGGQQQRLVIAMAVACRPRVVVMDEPTTGLDVTTEARILELINELRRAYDMSVLYVTHNLAVVSKIADRVVVMYAGRKAEVATKRALFDSPHHPYTRGLLGSVPTTSGERRKLLGISGSAPPPGARPRGCFFSPRCSYRTDVCTELEPPIDVPSPGREVRCHHWRRVDHDRVELGELVRDHSHMQAASLLNVSGLSALYRLRRGMSPVSALENVSFSVARQETVAIVGESGAGKSTLARCIIGLHQPSEGFIQLDGVTLPGAARHRSKDLRRAIQMVFQNAYGSLNPRITVRQSLTRRLKLLAEFDTAQRERRIQDVLDMVRLPTVVLERYPRALSGGEMQRVAIAQALLPNPRLVLCDEITSSLDVSVQAAILTLLGELAADLETSFVFISHDLAVVKAVAERVIVLKDGTVREEGRTISVFQEPKDHYTRALLAAAPRIERTEMTVPSA